MKINFKVLGLAAASLALIAGVRAAQALPSRAVESLNLTEQQQAEFDSLRTETRSQIEAILTDEQASAAQASIESGEPLHQALRELDLTDAQRSEIRTVMEGTREAGQAILTTEQQQQLAQHRAGRKGRGLAMLEELADELNLTEDQKAQFETLRTSTRAQVEDVLTDDQIAAFRSTIGEGGDFRQALRNLDLSDSQRDELRGVFESSRETAQGILTEEQQEQLQAIIQERMEGRRGQQPNRPIRR